MRVVESGYIYDAQKAPFHQRTCVRTTITRIADGTLISAFRWGSARESLDGHECVFASVDNGATWELRYSGFGKGAWDGVPGEVKGFEVQEIVPGELIGTGLWVDMSNPELPFINPETQGLLPMRIFHTASTDGGQTWGTRRRLDTTPHVAASPASAGPLPLSDGVLAQPYEVWKTYDDPTPGCPGAYLRLSYNNGETWPDYVTVAKHPQNRLAYWDERLAIHPDTRQMVAMFWTHDFNARIDRDVHIAWGTADGRSWTTPIGTGLPGQHCQPIPIGGDRLLAVYANRDNPPGITASLSTDFGQTWNRSHDVMVYNSTVGTESGAKGSRSQAELWNDMIAWRFGHPRGLLLPTGEVFVVFYAGDDEIKSAHWARLEV